MSKICLSDIIHGQCWVWGRGPPWVSLKGEEEKGDWGALELGLQAKLKPTLMCSSKRFQKSLLKSPEVYFVHNEKGSL